MKRARQARARWWPSVVGATVSAALVATAWMAFRRAEPVSAPALTELTALLKFPVEELRRVDVGLINLLSADGLEASVKVELSRHVAELDRVTTRVKAETDRHLPRFHRTPNEFNGSEAYFKMLCLVTVLQQDFGIRYNPQRAQPADGRVEPNESFYADASDVFLHGLLGPKRSGTCASLPVLYVTVGRRLGYPLKLVTAKNHLFVRWQSEGECLNIEATTEGLTTFEDDYYRRWPFPMTPEEEQTERHLISLSPAEELSVFLSLRTQCLLAAGHWDEALSSQEQVCRLAPYSENQREILERLRSQTKQLDRIHQNRQTALNL